MKKKRFAFALQLITILFGTIILLVAGCAKGEEQVPEKTIALPAPSPAPLNVSLKWDPSFILPQCRVDGRAPLLDEALASAGLQRSAFDFSVYDFEHNPYYAAGYLSDVFLLPWLEELRANPARAGCFEGKAAGALDYYATQPHPVSNMIRHAIMLLGINFDTSIAPIDPRHEAKIFDEALQNLCDVAGSCNTPEGELPVAFKKALVPLLFALAEGISARAAMEQEEVTRDADWWQRYGGTLILLSAMGEVPDPLNSSDRKYFYGVKRRKDLYRAAAKIAFAIEHTNWASFRDLRGIKYDFKTNAGWIRIRDGADHVYEDKGEDTLLLIDLGGNDTHFDPVASNRSGSNPVSIAIDLGGNDIYAYKTHATLYDRNELVPADEGGRYIGDEKLGNISLSNTFRQGAARNGIAMLFDFGNGNDHYQSLRGSQGYAHFGVGVLFDAGGNDTYLSEAASQGSAQFGIGLLIDLGQGNDVRKSFTYSQGFGYTAGAGILFDDGGDDSYICNHGNPKKSGLPFYYTPQLPGEGNSSFCQGAGFGRRGDDHKDKSFLSGGIGILRDVAGNDEYEASVFAQGAGYWQGIGILSDGSGDDRYDAYWYVQGGAAHFAVGILADAGAGSDMFNKKREARSVGLGTGHDFSLGVLINEKGNDRYSIMYLGAGASNCNGIGVFVDTSGDDEYTASSDYGSGMGNVSGECLNTTAKAKSIGIMIDGGGRDTYSYPPSSFPMPGDNKKWGHRRNNLPTEYGAGIDGEGETGIHAESEKGSLQKGE